MMYIMRLLSEGAIFQGDIEQVDREASIARMASCGSAPIGFAESLDEYKLVKGPELEGEAGGISIIAVGKPGRLTFGRISRVEDEYVMQIATGEAYREKDGDKYREALGFLSLPYAAIKLDGHPQKFVDNLRSQYMHICYDDLKEKLLEVCRVLDIRSIVS